MKRIMLMLLFAAGCAPQTTQMEACPETGCAPPTTSSDDAPKPTATLTRQAAFDLKCDPSKLAWTAIGTESFVGDIRSWGVRGCGKQATYLLEPRCGGFAREECSWGLNSPIQAAPVENKAQPAKTPEPPTGETQI